MHFVLPVHFVVICAAFCHKNESLIDKGKGRCKKPETSYR